MKTLHIEGMMCQNCVRHVREALEAVPGVTSVEVSLEAGTATVGGDAADQALIQAVTDADYEVKSVE